jgi:hypothetical protein
MTRNQEIAKIILEQLGGGRFAMFVGASNFVAIENGLSFTLKLGGFNKNAVRYVRVTLTPADDYTVEFIGRTGVLKSKAEGIYCDELQDCFLRHTGLRTRFGQ